ncbi:tRNA (5-methylaminomethyl-2-thiouridylate)-methyltransferase [Desulfocicer vacuolatum DSM 3385]|uniref:tRNA-specific 2-thiouridylase MnmA n=1 Tax=Desulfocicer vacuolatum DSM 3385 TaxID=1121400 RepID=A0A1W2E279_9BACT|nr:tRNA 2-thiouridine(34) synthase MnmA [Desulfocicer vacuolatum]SMD03951.1 tRNA (5-methylaminomethyl-2-thiouridylate)-methyltransferase [Desulfocicer vacuolatum DSM 3385]
MKKKIAIAVSGGVDSLVSAFLLKQQPHTELFGIHFTTGYESHPVDIPSLSRQLGLKILTVDLSRQFTRHVVDYFTTTYLSGKTPNPCIICNQTIKFGSLVSAAVQHGATHLATGHYARMKINDQGIPALYRGMDSIKEQSYFLAMLTANQLQKAIFPLGNMTKQEVVALARSHNLSPPEQKESQDICFIKESSFSDFIVTHTRKETFRPGPIVTPAGDTLGQHKGLHCYTVGQRRGLNCPGPAPYYVKKIDMENNRLVVGFKEDLLETHFKVKQVNWLLPTPLKSPITVEAKIRYSHKGETAQIRPCGSDGIAVEFNRPQNAVTPGQGAVFYMDDRVIGAGIIQ